MLHDQGITLPPLTEIVVGGSRLLRAWLPLLALPMFPFVAGPAVALALLPRGAATDALIHMPLVQVGQKL